ncbi:MAG: ABC transporter substrate-binding protein [Nitrospira sp.]|nr:ABC transporter substrate-binding protein [Nitrospira sp.]
MWLVPFASMVVIVLVLLRPDPQLPIPTPNRIVTDMVGRTVSIALPFKGVAVTWAARASDYLSDTGAPEDIVRMGAVKREILTRSLLGTIFPALLTKDTIWDTKPISRGRGPNAEVEALLAFKEASVFLGGYRMVPVFERVGLPVAGLKWDDKSNDVMLIGLAKMHTAISGHPERGEVLIERYWQAFHLLEQELQPARLDSQPRVLYMSSMTKNKRSLGYWNRAHPFNVYFPRAGTENAVLDASEMGSPDAERILLTDPDLILLRDTLVIPNSQSPAEFMADPRWQGMKAVAARRVYRLPTAFPVDMRGIGLMPVMVRLMAELAHPERLRPNVRTMLRDFVLADFGYRMSEDEIDAALKLDENGDSAGFDRFTRDYQKDKS